MASNTNDPAVFWREYAEEHGEAVLAHALGCYLSGWEEFEGPLWGLLIATDGGFRFHHFPHEGWITALARMSGGGGEAPKEKTVFVPKDRIVSATLHREANLLLRILTPRSPRLVLRYRRDDGSEGVLTAETDKTALPVAQALQGLIG